MMDFMEYDDLIDEPLEYKVERLGEFAEELKRQIAENNLVLDRQQQEIYDNEDTIREQYNKIERLKRKVLAYERMSLRVNSK